LEQRAFSTITTGAAALDASHHHQPDTVEFSGVFLREVVYPGIELKKVPD